MNEDEDRCAHLFAARTVSLRDQTHEAIDDEIQEICPIGETYIPRQESRSSIPPLNGRIKDSASRQRNQSTRYAR